MNNKERFSNRVDSYVKYRPSYPRETIDYLYNTIGLKPNCDIADIGAGTGIFSALLLERGSRVTAVEPNPEMRTAAEEKFAKDNHFHALPGSAEKTELPDQSVDFIVCAQAFHWFDRDAAQLEFKRILKPGGKAVLIWNSRRTYGTPFLEQYEQLVQAFGTDYTQVNHKNITPEILSSFFKTGQMQVAHFSNQQVFDFEGLSGRARSSSYIPAPGDPRYENMMTELRSLFERNKQDDKVFFEYETEIYWGEV
ncbi:class I SAM-dependent methyltransferase [Paenibacillus sp. FSL F4-0125]|uniref:class I SAM-dependent methyltransferase n=1 Tax=Paenibacillus sp. FSL F4-0125 TaxID=2954730 RepID=UPI0030FB7859